MRWIPSMRSKSLSHSASQGKIANAHTSSRWAITPICQQLCVSTHFSLRPRVVALTACSASSTLS